ncbi:MAG: hypothetical protein ACT4QA_05275 [Panacagrimonas sp.]
MALLLLAGVIGLPAYRASAEAAWVAVVVPAALTESLDADQIALIFRRKKVYAEDGGRFQPVNLPADSPLRRRFSRAVLRQSPEALEDYWNQQYFQGVLPPHVLASEAAVLRFVSSTTHAIGYLTACAMEPSLRALLLIDADGRVLPPSAVPECGEPDSLP